MLRYVIIGAYFLYVVLKEKYFLLLFVMLVFSNFTV
jgi:hypothetical protein